MIARVGRTGRGGFAVAMTLLYIVVLTAMIASVVNLLLTEQRLARHAQAHVQALYSAEAGVAFALAELNHLSRGGEPGEGWAREGARLRYNGIPAVLNRAEVGGPELSIVADREGKSITARARVKWISGIVERAVTVKCVDRDGRLVAAEWRENRGGEL